MSYPEKVAYDWLKEHNIEFEHQKRFKLNGKVRYVDFYVYSRKLIIEIDGEYWHPEGNIDDVVKDKIAQENGY